MSLNKYLTKLQDTQFNTKAQITRAKNFSKKFHKRRIRKEKRDKVDKLVSKGMGEFQALFEVEYGSNIRELSKQKNHLSDRIKPRSFVGKSMPIPIGVKND